ncbi:ribonucleotide-diphosphate reductase subunit beta [Nitrincola sp. A-D6]|uniref:ribonucleotide-diphosphate reductase subunit beta n=1 Tax=Nitrincola sp. A-D6 TaxID=1545442 RepID=UPI00051FB17B|nr:ribonucleotide-diphosphate reductase subunit beta [Nitrincola sp. A-D6]KGK41222.1 ribonucleotide-diphosphate reductase subunit beta [Nitrincola sp. A-D6]
MSLLKARSYYKPLHYEWAFQAFEMQNKMHWIPEEVPLHEDVKDWNNTLSDSDKYLITQLFRFFTQGDVDVAQGYYDKFIPLFKPTELRMALGAFAAMEGIHVHAYSLLLDTIGMPESEYKAFTEYEEMLAKHEYVSSFDPTAFNKNGEYSKEQLREIAKTLAVYSAFTEGLQLFSSFAILLNFSREPNRELGEVKKQTMKGMGQIVTWSIRDESLHVETMVKLFHEFIHEFPEIWTDDFRGELYQIARNMVELEDNFIDLCFGMGDVEGLSKEDVKQYIRFICDRRLLQLGLKPNYGVKKNPLVWMEEVLSLDEHMNFFEGRATEYSKGAMTGSWNDVWK